VNIAHAVEVAPVVAEIMGSELSWDPARCKEESDAAIAMLHSWHMPQGSEG
jgi:hypothetical protein